jgi:hypothetical protein
MVPWQAGKMVSWRAGLMVSWRDDQMVDVMAEHWGSWKACLVLLYKMRYTVFVFRFADVIGRWCLLSKVGYGLS